MINRFRALGIIGLAPYLVLSQSAFPIAAGSSDIGSKSGLLIAEAKAAMDTAPAISGVKLLQEIFQRLRNSNQLALNNPTKQLTAASQAFQGALNPLLAIRPSEKSLNKSSPSLAYALQDRRMYSNQNLASSDAGSNSQIKEYSPKRKMASARAAQSAAQSAAPSAAQSAAQSDKASAPVVASAAINSSSAPTDSFTRGLVLDSRPQQPSPSSTPTAMRFEFKPNTYANEQKGSRHATNMGASVATSTTGNTAQSNANARLLQQNNQMLVRSVSNLMQSTKQLSELSQANDSSVRTYAARRRDSRDDKTLATLPGGPVIQEYGTGSTTKISGSKDLGADSARIADGDMSDNSPLMVPDQPAQYRIMRNQLMALLPPSVVSGIPLARLGATEQELTTALSNKNAQKQKIEDWTIWTLKGSEHSAGVQLYLRHSVVEAIRVFQPSYLGDDVGIRIGDDLLTVKRKFGEPALILAEPDAAGKHSADKNYVYPISHVAFQLARSKAAPNPQVVSVLIFDVQ
jgi:hypothetical protein